MGWIGRIRLQALLEADIGTVVAVADPDPSAAAAGAAAADGSLAVADLDELLRLDLDGVVIATPSALHAEQSLAALDHGLAVFCQKPMARSATEAEAVLATARRAGRPFGVDLSYRRTAAAQRMQQELRQGRIGRVFAAQLTFHNAYGPDKQWFLDRHRSGGGCLIDLGTHLLDLLLWLLGDERLRVEAATLLQAGAKLANGSNAVEDFVAAQLTTASGAAVQLACSWFLPAGLDCLFECTLFGTEGSLALTNVDGSFHDFRLEWRHGTSAQLLVSPPDDWGGRTLCDWALRLQRGEGFDPELAAELHAIPKVIDAIYRYGGVQR